MYSSPLFHIVPILHFLFSFILLFILFPRWLFTSQYDEKIENWYSGYVKMLLLLIISGYVLVIAKLYEVLSILFMILILIEIHNRRMLKDRRTSHIPVMLKSIFDLLDGLSKFNPKSLYLKLKNQAAKIRENWNWFTFAEGITLFLILAISIYVRFYDTFANAAPPLSDSYVTLAWMKYINNRLLFHDGIYPQGFHIYLATILKFAAVDPIFILRYTGPLNAVMVTAGLYVVVKKLTNNAIGALTAAWIYGILWVILPMFSTERQAATNSQEFAFVFIFPAIYFLIKFFQTEKKEDLLVGLISTTIIGLVHSIGYALAGLMIGVMLFASAITLKKHWKPYIQTIMGAILTGILSFVPLGIGYLLGKNLNSSSAEYLTSRNNTYHLTALNHLDYVALGSLVLLILLQFRKKLSREDRFIGIFTALTGSSVFAIYYAGGYLTHSTVIESRSIDLWGLTIPFCIGISVAFLFNLLKKNWMLYINVAVMLGLIMATLVKWPSPIIPYKLEYNENVEQVLRISQQHLPQTWMIVSQDEGYPMAFGKGYHMHLGDFLNTYNPSGKMLTKFGETMPDRNIPLHIFVFQEKKVFEVSKTNSVYSILEPKYKQRKQEYKELTKWMKVHEKAGNPIKIFYQNKHIIVYEFDMPEIINQ